MTLASVGQKIISFVYFTMIANRVGVEDTGKYFFALSFTTVFVVFIDLGLTNVLVREAARTKEKLQEYFSVILSAKLVLAVLSYAAAFFTIRLLGYPVETRQLVYLSAITMVFDSFHLTFYGALRAIGNLKYEAVSITVSQFMTLVLGGMCLYLRLPLIYLIGAFTVPSMLNALFAATTLKNKYGVALRPAWNKQVFVHVAGITVPFAIAAVLARLYSYVDSIILSRLAGDAAVGWYSIPYKITYAFQFVPLALVAAVYPRFSEYFHHDKLKLAHLFEQGTKYLLLIVCPIAVGLSILAHDIVLELYSDAYLPSILPLQILLVGLIFSYISFPIGAFLNACNHQKTQTTIVAFVLVINIVLNLIFIPQYGIIAAAGAALVGNVLLAALGYLVIPRIAMISHRYIGRTVLQVAAASLLMGLGVYAVNYFVHFTVSILVGAVIYVAALLLTGTLTKEQLVEVRVLLKKT